MIISSLSLGETRVSAPWRSVECLRNSAQLLLGATSFSSPPFPPHAVFFTPLHTDTKPLAKFDPGHTYLPGYWLIRCVVGWLRVLISLISLPVTHPHVDRMTTPYSCPHALSVEIEAILTTVRQDPSLSSVIFGSRQSYFTKGTSLVRV